MRMFKIATGTQLVFNALNVHSGALDCVCALGARNFAVGAQDGSVSLWDQGRKTPLAVVKAAHSGKWITAVAEFVLFSELFDRLVMFWFIETVTEFSELLRAAVF